MLHFTGPQIVGLHWGTKLNWAEDVTELLKSHHKILTNMVLLFMSWETFANPQVVRIFIEFYLKALYFEPLHSGLLWPILKNLGVQTPSCAWTICWEDCWIALALLLKIKWLSVSLSLNYWFCSVDLFIDYYVRTLLATSYSFRMKSWIHVLLVLQLCSCFSVLVLKNQLVSFSQRSW